MKSAAFGLLFACVALGQASAFEVASIRSVTDASKRFDGGFFCPFACIDVGRLKVEGARVDIAFMALDELIRRAYRIRPDQLDGQDWMRNQRFDILANIPEGASTAQVPEMLQSLLAERFRLAAHHEMRERPVYALVVDKNGSTLKRSVQVDLPDAPGDDTLNSPQGPLRARENNEGITVTKSPWGPMRMPYSSSDRKDPEIEFLKVTTPLLADALTQFMDRPVIDRTNLKGAYQVTLFTQDIIPFVLAKLPPGPGATPNPGNGPASPSDPTGGSTIFKTLEKLGLKLERTKAPVETLVVDHLEKTPTDN